MILQPHADGDWPVDASAVAGRSCGGDVVAVFFPRACCARVILACWVESVRPAVAAHCAWLGVLLFLVTAASCGLVGVVFFVVAVLHEESDGVGEHLDLEGHGFNFF